MSTPHNTAVKGEIAKTVLMPGDPLRAKFIAETFLENPVQFNSVRNMFGYTGTYKGKRISVMDSDMGMPSIGIYSYELYSQYDVENIIRVGTCGSYSTDLHVFDVILGDYAWSDSSFAKVQSGDEDDRQLPSATRNNKIEEAGKKLGITVHHTGVHSSDVFYSERAEESMKQAMDNGCKVCEMESFALFHNAKVLGKHASVLLTVSDSLVNHEYTSPEERQNAFTKMMEVALEAAE